MADFLRHSYEHILTTPDSPFGNDTLHRIPFSNLLTSIVANYSNGFVMAINGAWGTGKTVFMHQWAQTLTNKGFRATIFNAWENDYFGEPTLALLSQFRYFFDEDRPLSEKAASLWKTLQKVPLCAIKGFVAKKMSDTIGENAVKEISDTYNENNESDINYRESDIAKYVEQRIDFLSYKNALIKFASAVATEGKPLVFIIDELDRCTPSYAVEVLEKIKHLFNIPNIVFCFSIDKEQLKKTIQGHYGAYNFNAEEYLRRFFDVELELPPIRYDEFADLMVAHFGLDQLIKSSDNLREFVKTSTLMSQKQHLTLRQLEKFYAHSKLVFSYYNATDSEWLIGVMLIINKFANELFLKIVDKEWNLNFYASSLKMLFDMEEYSTGANRLGALLYHIQVYLNNDENVSVPEDFKFDWTSDFTEKQLETMSWCYKAESRQSLRSVSLKRIISKICFIEQFVAKP